MSEKRSTYVMVDIEADGPIPGDYSMISIGAVVVNKNLDRTFRADLKPISERFVEKSLEICGVSRVETLSYDDPKKVMERFADWLDENAEGRPRFISDNNGFDWMFICWYFHHFLGRNPFGYSSDNLGSLYRGLVEDMSGSFKWLRKTEHTHDPLDDAKGNAEALWKMWKEMSLIGPEKHLFHYGESTPYQFSSRDSGATNPKSAKGQPWKILVVDDEPTVHEITRLVLRDFTFRGRPVAFTSVYSAKEAKTVLRKKSGFALIWLNVVMETDSAGLRLVPWIRDDLGDPLVRILIRTGNPGMTPQRQVVQDFEINAYYEKAELVAEKFVSATTNSLRSYDQLSRMQKRIDGLESDLERIGDPPL